MAAGSRTPRDGEVDADPPVPGVTGLDHAADVGLTVEAPTVDELFRRAALGTLWLALGTVPRDRSESRAVELQGDGHAALLREWLREVLYWLEAEGFAISDARFDFLDSRSLSARVEGGPAQAAPIREIKGVTWHDLSVERVEEGWIATVIFDV